MARKTETSRGGKRTRGKQPDHPIPHYCRAALRQSGWSAAKMSRELEVTKGLISQWMSGETFPPGDQLVNLSLKSGLSLGYLSMLSAEYANLKIPFVHGFDARIAAMKPDLRDGVLNAIENAERLQSKFPQVFGPAVKDDDTRLHGWSAKGKK